MTNPLVSADIWYSILRNLGQMFLLVYLHSQWHVESNYCQNDFALLNRIFINRA